MLESVVGRDFLPRGSGKSRRFVLVFCLCVYRFAIRDKNVLSLSANLFDLRGIGRCVIMMDFILLTVYSILEDLHFSTDKGKLNFIFLHFVIY